MSTKKLMKKIIRPILIFLMIFSFLLGGVVNFQVQAAPANVTGWGWFGADVASGGTTQPIGWVSFNSANHPACPGVSYKVISDYTAANPNDTIRGQAWIGVGSDADNADCDSTETTTGWLDFDDSSIPSFGSTYEGGVYNFPARIANIGGGNYEIQGWAPLKAGNTFGWIQFKGLNHSVRINPDGSLIGYAWAGNSSDTDVSGLGWLDLSSVKFTISPTLYVLPTVWTVNLAQGSNASQIFTVSTSYGNFPWTVSADQPWISFDKTSGSTPSSFTATANVSAFTLGTYNANITVSASDAGNSPIIIPVTINIGRAFKVTGDIFAKGAITGFEVDSRSVVVSQSGQINVSGTTYTIPNYTFATALNWALAKAQMDQNVARLKSTKAATYRPQGADDVVIDGIAKPAFNLNPDPFFSPDPFANPNVDPNSPDGGVFWVKGNLTLKNTQFKAKGTIIVDGNLIVEGDTSYSAATTNSSLGIIVLGNINIRPSVNNLVGAYFTPNNLVVESGSGNLFTFNGLLIGGTSLVLNRESFTISYDPRIVSLAPPGFSQFYLPIFREATP